MSGLVSWRPGTAGRNCGQLTVIRFRLPDSLAIAPMVRALIRAAAAATRATRSSRNPTEEATPKRRANVLEAAKRFAAGEGDLKALNPDWDSTLLDQAARGDLVLA